MSETMRALVKARPEPGIWMEEVPVPEPRPHEVLIRVKKTAICGTDIHIYKWDEWASRTVPVPMVTGHEFFGVIARNGSAATRYPVGMRVCGEGHIVCGQCRNCRAGRGQLCCNTIGIGVNRPGSFADYISIPESNVVPIPEDIADEVAAIFDPYGNAVHTALSFPCVGEDVLVTGAGPIGIMAALVAKRSGARKVVITDINAYRLRLAKTAGVEMVVDANKENLGSVMTRIGMKEGFDIGMEMSGAASAFRDMIAAMNNGGRVAILGIPPRDFAIDWNEVIFKMLTLKGIYGREMYDTWYKMIALIQGGLDLKPIITHRLPVAEYEAGFQTMASGNCGKVVLDWSLS